MFALLSQSQEVGATSLVLSHRVARDAREAVTTNPMERPAIRGLLKQLQNAYAWIEREMSARIRARRPQSHAAQAGHSSVDADAQQTLSEPSATTVTKIQFLE